MNDTAKGGMLVLFMALLVILIIFIGSWLSLLSINTLFGLNIPITLENILAATWLTLTLKGIFTTNLKLDK